MNHQIRSATENDEAAVVELWRSCGLVVSHNDPNADFRFARDGAGSDVLIAVDADHRVVGSVMVGHDGHRGWLYYVAVDPAGRRRGIGRSMVEAAEQWLAKRGIVKAQLMIRETNVPAVKFYERIGYDAMPRINMQKWLKRP